MRFVRVRCFEPLLGLDCVLEPVQFVVGAYVDCVQGARSDGCVGLPRLEGQMRRLDHLKADDVQRFRLRVVGVADEGFEFGPG